MFKLKRPSVASLIQEIIAAASDKTASLEQVLLKAQVLSARLGNAELGRWAKSEIEGYSGDDSAPSYRRVPVRLRGDCIGQTFHYMVRGPQDIPLDVIPEEHRDDFRWWTAYQGVAAIESLVRDSGEKTPRIPIERGLQDLLRQQLGGPDITSIYLEVAPTSLETMLSAVRSRVLDLVLALDAEFGEEPPEKPSDLDQSEREFVERVVHLHIKGDGNAVNIDSPHARQRIRIERGDWTALESELHRLGVPPAEIAELKDDPSGALAWLQRMTGKAATGALKVAGATTMKQITKAVMAFAGLPC